MPRNIEWQRHKETIVSLYETENMSLAAVMAEMEKLGFYASKSSYTNRLKEWHSSKNTKAAIYKTIGHKLKRKGIALNDAKVSINGHLIPTKKLKKEVNRYAEPEWNINFGDQNPRTPENVSICDNEIQHDTSVWFPTLPSFDMLRIVDSGGVYITSVDSSTFLTRCFGLTPTSNPLRLECTAFSAMEPLMIQQSSGDATCTVWALRGPSSTMRPSDLMIHMAFHCSNKLISDCEVDTFVCRMVKQDRIQEYCPLLARILMSSSSTARALATCIFHSAVAQNLCQFVELLLDLGMNVNELSHDRRRTPLQCALRASAVEVALVLIHRGADVNATGYGHNAHSDGSDDNIGNESGCLSTGANNAKPPIAIASRNWATLRFIPLLIQRGARVPRSGIINDTVRSLYKDRGPFEFSDQNENLALVKSLIDLGASVNDIATQIDNLSQPTAIQAATMAGDVKMVQLLLERGACPDGPVTPNNFAFLRKSANERKLHVWCLSPLTLAARGSDDPSQFFALLLGAGANINVSAAEIVCDSRHACAQDARSYWFSRSFEGCMVDMFTSLQAAVHKQDIKSVKYLLKCGAKTETRYGPSSLAIAAGNGNFEMVRLLLHHEANVNSCSEQGLTPLIAVPMGVSRSPEMLATLLRAGAHVDHRPKITIGSRTALQAACCGGELELAKILLGAGANVNACCAPDDGITALQGALLSGCDAVTDLILKHDACVNACCTAEGGTTALLAAISAKNLSYVVILISFGARVNEIDRADKFPTPLERAAETGAENIVRALVTAGSKINRAKPSANHPTSLQLAVQNNYERIAQILLKYGADINSPPPHEDTRFKTALGWAVSKKNVAMVRMLVRKGADVTMPTCAKGPSPLGAACNCWNPDLEIVKILLDGGADSNNGGHGTHPAPLTSSMFDRGPELARLLIARGADVNGRPSMAAWTPLQAAATRNGIEFACVLIHGGADVNAPPSTMTHGRTALQAAVEQGNVQMVSLLLSRGADVNAPAGLDSGVTALQAAATRGYFLLAQVLLTHGADIGAAASPLHGRTAIQGAAERGRLDMVKYLLDNYKGVQSKAQLCGDALEYARKKNQWHVIELLEDYSKTDGFGG